jgi:hypothetical protein
MESRFKEFLNLFRRLGWWGALGLSLVLLVGSVVLAAALVVRWPVEKFKGSQTPRFWGGRPPVVRVVGLVGKNVAGYLIVLVGLVLAIPGVPGQGALLILIGLTLVDFPGKRRAERALIRKKGVLRVVNSLRKRFGHPPLEID